MGDKLGEGAHASVYKCFLKSDVNMKTPYAVKIMRERDEEKREAMTNEYNIQSKLVHRNICKAIEYFHS